MYIQRVAFTSCIRYEAFPDQPQWDEVSSLDPDYLFLLGDQIYMDYGYWPFSDEWNGRPAQYSDAEFERIMKAKYVRQCAEPHFRKLYDKMRAQNRIFAIWDDHDFAWNNAVGSEVDLAKRKISFELFSKYFPTSIPNEIYQAINTPLARVIFLDVRSHAKRPHSTPSVLPGSDSDLLGESQFRFLEDELIGDHGKPFTIICSGISLRLGEECWIRYADDYQRLMQALKQSGKKIIFLAGDIHKNAFMPPSLECSCYEIVSSGFAVNYLGLGIPNDDRHNWGLLELRENGTGKATLYEHGKEKEVQVLFDV